MQTKTYLIIFHQYTQCLKARNMYLVNNLAKNKLRHCWQMELKNLNNTKKKYKKKGGGNKKMLKKIIANLMVEDVAKTVKFYKDKINCFQLIMTDPKEGELDWAMMRCGSEVIMFQSKRSLSEKLPELKDKEIGGTAIIYIETENIKELYDWFSYDVEVLKELHDTPWGRKEFYIKDCNGYILVFAE